VLAVLKDGWVEARGREKGHTHPSLRPALRIDYVMASPDVSVMHAEVRTTTASDHLPVVLDVALP
jgi:endonuclease/exonuclease/phosphatase family metal-dependent hydrolase